MKILLVTNKTLSNRKTEWIDGGYYNVFLPLIKMGHEVHFFDTVRGGNKSFSATVESFKPELIFCCMTGDPSLTPREPWEGIIEETKKGNCKTFNWFCDDAWRFESFSSVVCKYFHVCSTPEVHYIERFKQRGYNNILLGFWHGNKDFYPQESMKSYDIGFCGQLNYDRRENIEYLKNNNLQVASFHGLTHEKMFQKISEFKIGINFSKNYNGRSPVLQMKGRMVEVPAANTLLLTEYAPGLETHFEIDREIVTFKTPDEMLQKTRYLVKNPKLVATISKNGHERFLKEHESTVRLSRLLKEIIKL